MASIAGGGGEKGRKRGRKRRDVLYSSSQRGHKCLFCVAKNHQKVSLLIGHWSKFHLDRVFLTGRTEVKKKATDGGEKERGKSGSPQSQ
jgi:hypothetical protein